MTTNFFRALTFFLSIMTGFLFYLSAFFLIDTTKTSSLKTLEMGDLLVPTILFATAVPLAWIILKNLIPRLFNTDNQEAIRFCRRLLIIGFFGIFSLGYIH